MKPELIECCGYPQLFRKYFRDIILKEDAKIGTTVIGLVPKAVRRLPFSDSKKAVIERRSIDLYDKIKELGKLGEFEGSSNRTFVFGLLYRAALPYKKTPGFKREDIANAVGIGGSNIGATNRVNRRINQILGRYVKKDEKKELVYGKLVSGDLSSIVTTKKGYEILASEKVRLAAELGNLTRQLIKDKFGEDYFLVFEKIVASGIFVKAGYKKGYKKTSYKLNKSIDISKLEERIPLGRDLVRLVAKRRNFTKELILDKFGEDYASVFRKMVASGIFVKAGYKKGYKKTSYKLNKSIDISNLEERVFSGRDFSEMITNKTLEYALFFKEELGVDKWVDKEVAIETLSKQYDRITYPDIFQPLFNFGCVKMAFPYSSNIDGIIYLMTGEKAKLIEQEARKRGIQYERKAQPENHIPHVKHSDFSITDIYPHTLNKIYEKIVREDAEKAREAAKKII